ncbi:MAG: glycosyltransferase family 2 protein [Planctomycetes bacterium]|nr:glycosyltransferase family 2 protein [Planctomycetota bacterium]
MKLDILIPVYNEEKTVSELLSAVSKLKCPGVEISVTVVNDGSSDNTKDIILQHSHLYSQFIDLKQNLGKGGAVQAGLKACTGDYVVFQDGDLEYDPLEISQIAEVLLKFQPDVTYGSRFLAPKVTRVAYFYNKLGNYMITGLFNLLNNTTFTDIYSCYFCYRRDLINPDELKCMGWDQQAEILAKVVKRGKVFYEVPISYYGRSIEEGKKIRAHHIFSVFTTIIKERFLGS